jgi:REP element-mobilizing transposase RayT
MDGFDYATPGCYFVTINTRRPGDWFGHVSEGWLYPNDAGTMVLNVWDALPERFPGIIVDAIILMPDHVHGIVMLGTEPEIPADHSLSDVIGAFKSISAAGYGRGVREAGWPPYNGHFCNGHFWHRSFRDTIIRTGRMLDTFRAYIEGNPGRWTEKHER